MQKQSRKKKDIINACSIFNLKQKDKVFNNPRQTKQGIEEVSNIGLKLIKELVVSQTFN